MLEAVLAMTIFALAGTAVLMGISTLQVSGAKTESQSVAENLARNQMEQVFSQPYQDPPSTYPSYPTPTGYSVTAVAEEYVVADPNVQMLRVTVNHEAEVVLVLETLRVKQ